MVNGVTSLVLFCKDADAARGWYESMGFTYQRGYDGMHWFAAGSTEVMLHPADKTSGGSGLCMHVGVPDAAAAFQMAIAAGHAPYDHQQPGVALTGPVTRPWGAVEFELDDPEGHRWAFTQSA